MKKLLILSLTLFCLTSVANAKVISNEKIDNWSKGCFYGYYLIDSLTFGVNFCPTKGLFFCFTYNYF